MSVSYRAVGWNKFKKRYDLLLVIGIILYIALFMAVSLALNPSATAEIMLIRATGTAGILLLHIILCIGPLARLDPRWLPILYNRRHLGVSMFLLGLIHAALVVLTYHVGADLNPWVSIFVSDAGTTMGTFPFQAFGFFALLILFLMAATSHDFWLANLTAPVWKSLHMLVYVAYALLIVHVVFGVLQTETHPVYATLVAAGFAAVAGLHLTTGIRERPSDQGRDAAAVDAFVDVCHVDDIQENRARMVTLSGERVAVFKYDGKISAVSNVCQHQNGPLGEGKVVDGCITCPWHGYQYAPETGESPPPFTEKIPTFHVKVEGGRVLVRPTPNPPGRRVAAAAI
jgi:nitrite reductase/ring-hydroxylating ferredoxin subunit/DMSO/TMAO reductase YedYZ heme-binding membrane subunit